MKLVTVFPAWLLIGAAACSSGDILSPATEPAKIEVSTQIGSVENDRQTYEFGASFNRQCSSAEFLPGTYKVFLSVQYKKNADGTITFFKETLTGHGTLTDALGIVTNLVQIGKTTQVFEENGSFVLQSDQKFMLISHGPTPNEFIEIGVLLRWDGTTFTPEATFNSDCRGKGTSPNAG